MMSALFLSGDAPRIASAFLTGPLAAARQHYPSDAAMVNDFFDKRPIGSDVPDWDGLRARVLQVLRDGDARFLRSLEGRVDELERRYLKLTTQERRLFHLSDAYPHICNAAAVLNR